MAFAFRKHFLGISHYSGFDCFPYLLHGGGWARSWLSRQRRCGEVPIVADIFRLGEALPQTAAWQASRKSHHHARWHG